MKRNSWLLHRPRLIISVILLAGALVLGILLAMIFGAPHDGTRQRDNDHVYCGYNAALKITTCQRY